jgi:hypothetical protein
MGFDAKTERLISLKKLSGKAHTSNDKGLANEALPSGITISSATIFSEAITASPTATPYWNNGVVEFLRLQAEFITGADTSDGRHGFRLKLPSDYVSNSTNPNKGAGVFVNNQVLNESSGKLQLVPATFAAAYEAKPHYGTIGSGTRIYLLDDRDWNLDYFNAVYFQQDPPGTGDHAQNPTYVEAYIYIGDFLDDVVDNISSSGSGSSSSGSTTLREKNIYVATNTIVAATNILVDGVNFNLANQDPELIDIHLNGMLIAHSDELGIGTSDYDIIDYQTIQLSFDIETDDMITISVFNKTAIAAMAYNEIPTGTIDGVNMVFTLSNEPANGATLSLNGQILTPTATAGTKDYTLSGDTITLTIDYPPTDDDVLLTTYSY